MDYSIARFLFVLTAGMGVLSVSPFKGLDSDAVASAYKNNVMIADLASMKALQNEIRELKEQLRLMERRASVAEKRAEAAERRLRSKSRAVHRHRSGSKNGSVGVGTQRSLDQQLNRDLLRQSGRHN